MSFSDYSRFSHLFNVLNEATACEKSKNDLLVNSKKSGNKSSPFSGEVSSILKYLITNRAQARKLPSDKLKQLRERLEKATTDAHLIATVFDEIIAKKGEQIPEVLQGAPPRIVHFINVAPTNDKTLEANLRAVIENPNLTLTHDFAVIDGYHGQLPIGWNRETIFQNLTSKITTVDPKSALTILLQQVRDEYRAVQVTPLNIGIVESPGEDPRHVINQLVYPSLIRGTPTLITKAMIVGCPNTIKTLLRAHSLALYTQEPGSLTLLLPSKHSPEKLGFSMEGKGKLIKWGKPIEEITAIPAVDIVQDIADVLRSNDETTVFHRVFTLGGHGLHAIGENPSIVCGLPLEKFQDLLEVMKNKSAGLGIITSCFSGGESSQSFTIPAGGLPFPLIVRSSTEQVVRTSLGGFKGDERVFLGDLYGKTLRRALDTSCSWLFANHPTGKSRQHPKQLTLRQLQEISDVSDSMPRALVDEALKLTTLFLPSSDQAIPRIAYGNATGYRVLNVDLAMQGTHNTEVCTNKPILFFSSPLAKTTIKNESSDAVLLLSRGGRSQHVISNLEVPRTTLFSLAFDTYIDYGRLREGLIAEKLYFVEKLTCSLEGKRAHLRNVVINKRPDRTEILFQDRDKKFHKASLIDALSFFEGRILNPLKEISKEEYTKTLYLRLLSSKPSEGLLRQTTGGRIGQSKVLSQVRRSIWGNAAPSSALLFERVLLNKNEDLNGTQDQLREALRLGVTAGSIDSVDALLNKVDNINGSDDYGKTLLISAAEAGNGEMVEHLMNLGADTHQKDDLGFTAFHWAIIQGHSHLANKLLKSGCPSQEKTLGLSITEWLLIGGLYNEVREHWDESPEFSSLAQQIARLTVKDTRNLDRFVQDQLRPTILEKPKNTPETVMWIRDILRDHPQEAIQVKEKVTPELWNMGWQAFFELSVETPWIKHQIPLPQAPELQKEILLRTSPWNYADLVGYLDTMDGSLIPKEDLDDFLNNLIKRIECSPFWWEEKHQQALLKHRWIREKDWPQLIETAVNNDWLEFLVLAQKSGQSIDPDALKTNPRFWMNLAKGDEKLFSAYNELGVQVQQGDLHQLMDPLIDSDNVRFLEDVPPLEIQFSDDQERTLVTRAIAAGALNILKRLVDKGVPLPTSAKLGVSTKNLKDVTAILASKGVSIKIDGAEPFPDVAWLLQEKIPFTWENREKIEEGLLKLLPGAKPSDLDTFIQEKLLPLPESEELYALLNKFIQDKENLGAVWDILRYRKLWGKDHDLLAKQDREILSRCLKEIKFKSTIPQLFAYTFHFEIDQPFLSDLLNHALEVPTKDTLTEIENLLALGAKIAAPKTSFLQQTLLEAAENGNAYFQEMLTLQGVTFDKVQFKARLDELAEEIVLSASEPTDNWDKISHMLTYDETWAPSPEQRLPLLKGAIKHYCTPLLKHCKAEKNDLSALNEVFEELSVDPSRITTDWLRALYEVLQPLSTGSQKKFKNILDTVLDISQSMSDTYRRLHLVYYLLSKGIMPDKNTPNLGLSLERFLGLMLDDGRVQEARILSKSGAPLIPEIVQIKPRSIYVGNLEVLDFALEHQRVPLTPKNSLFTDWIWPALQHGQYAIVKKLKDAAPP